MTPDPKTDAGARALGRLRDEPIGWLTTVTPDGQPQSTPIWFRWTGEEILVYSHRRAHRNGNVADQPRVSFTLNTDPTGDEYVIVEGLARIDPAAPPPSADTAYLAKYEDRIRAYGWTVDWFAAEYPHLIRIAPTRWRVA